jgi:hypothetical protein
VRAEHALRVRKVAFDPFRRAAQLAFVGPEFPFCRGDEDFRIRESRFVVDHQQAVDMVSVEMRDHNCIDRIAVDTGGSQIGLELTHRTLALLERAGAEAGIEGDELRSRVDDYRRERKSRVLLVKID